MRRHIVASMPAHSFYSHRRLWEGQLLGAKQEITEHCILTLEQSLSVIIDEIKKYNVLYNLTILWCNKTMVRRVENLLLRVSIMALMKAVKCYLEVTKCAKQINPYTKSGFRLTNSFHSLQVQCSTNVLSTNQATEAALFTVANKSTRSSFMDAFIHTLLTLCLSIASKQV